MGQTPFPIRRQQLGLGAPVANEPRRVTRMRRLRKYVALGNVLDFFTSSPRFGLGGGFGIEARRHRGPDRCGDVVFG